MNISEQAKELRETAELFDEIDDGRRMLLQAADTIEALSEKLEVSNGRWWVACDKDNLPDKEVLCFATSSVTLPKT